MNKEKLKELKLLLNTFPELEQFLDLYGSEEFVLKVHGVDAEHEFPTFGEYKVVYGDNFDEAREDVDCLLFKYDLRVTSFEINCNGLLDIGAEYIDLGGDE